MNNRGDESAHKALVRSLSREFPQHSIEVAIIMEQKDSVHQFMVKEKNVSYWTYLSDFKNPNFFQKCYRAVVVHRLFNQFLIYAMSHQKVNWLRLNPITRRIWKKINEADIVVNAPGGICMGGFQNWRHIAYLEMARRSGKDIYYYGRSFGPFPEETEANRVFKEFSIRLLRSFKFLAIRDKKSEQLADSLGLSYQTTVDTAFLETPRAEIPHDVAQAIGNNYMVFVPNALRWHFAYRSVPQERIDNLFNGILEKISQVDVTMKIVMLPQTFNYRTRLMNDINFFRDLRMSSPYHDRIIVVDDKYSSDIQQTIIAGSRFLVGARYHSAVFAINNSVPFIALSYEHKIEGMLSSLGDSESMMDISDLSAPDRVETILEAFSQRLRSLSFHDQTTLKAKSVANECFLQLKKCIHG